MSTSRSCSRSTTRRGTCAPRSTGSGPRWTRRRTPTRSSSSTTARTTARASSSREIEGIRLIQFAQNRGSGSARRAGSHAARGRVVVWTDADMTYPNDEIPQLVKELDGYDQVVGARTSEQGTAQVRPGAGQVAHPQAGQLPRRDEDPGPQLRAAGVPRRRRPPVPEPAPGRASRASRRSPCAFLANGYSVKYVPIEYSPRAGKSKFHWWKDTRRYLTQVVRMVLSYNPLRVFLPLALLLLAIGGVKLVYDAIVVRPPRHDEHAADALRRVPAPRDRVAGRPLRPALETERHRGSRVAVNPY